MGFKCGLVGLPNVGKSTIFNLLTKLNSPAENFPFCTIKPNVGIVPIYDNRLNKIAKIVSSDKIIPTTIELVDIAGLVKGSYKGEGLGNKFLEYIKDVHVIIHVVRCFEDDSVVHIYGKVQPIEDIDIINLELILSDIEICKKRLFKLSKKYRNNKKEVCKECLILKLFISHLEKYKALRLLNLSKEDLNLVQYLRLITLKPIVYALNLSNDLCKNLNLENIYSFIRRDSSRIVKIFLNTSSFSYENNILANGKLSLNQCNSKQLQDVVLEGYKALNLITFFTAGKKEVHAWTTTKHTCIYKSVKCIHTDLSRGFIRAQVISYDDFIKYSGEKKLKEAGKIRLEGKKYFIQDGDIVNVLYKV